MVQSHSPRGRSGPMQVKVTMDGQGRSRRVVLQPLSMQGVVSIDDGREWVTLFPDSNKLMIQASPYAYRADLKSRLARIEQNYRLRFEETKPIAGRETVAVVAQPRSGELYTRRYTLDAETYVLMRYEDVEQGGRTRTMLDTVTIDLGREFPADMFRPPSGEGLKIERTWGPRRASDTARVRELVGFVPRTPKGLPYGFAIDDVHLLGSPDAAFVAVRISDGLAMLSVYQWDGNRAWKDRPVRSSRPVQDAYGVFFAVSGDAPEEVRKKIAEAFARFAKDDR